MHLKSILSAAVLFSSFFTAFAVDTTPVDLHELMAVAGVTGGESEYDEAAYNRYLNAKNELLPTPTRRDEGAGYVESLSNAQRLAKGLPLKAPARRQPSRIWNRDAAASPLPRETVTGRAALYNQNGERVFYVDRNLNTAGFTSLTTDVDNALTLSVSFDTLQPVFTKIQVTMLNLATSGFPLLSLIQGRDDTNTDMTAGSFHYTYLGGAAEPGSGPGSTGSSTIGNTYTDRTGLPRVAQTDIWTYDPATTVLAPTWINSNNDNVEIPFYSQSNAIYGLKDSDAFHTRYPAPVTGPFTLKLEPIV
ncbi:hypothetical protein D9611_006593 [Ephemerocybe angulata]|uniref:Uncharacterized protein n=1 Tax=Ephemerocybe angulata TaxID=980116 RepID=A0A8H5C868_9AGAR|nr:hypothetical protein D9611_006593 [Tulosesus angulatus]